MRKHKVVLLRPNETAPISGAYNASRDTIFIRQSNSYVVFEMWITDNTGFCIGGKFQTLGNANVILEGDRQIDLDGNDFSIIGKSSGDLDPDFSDFCVQDVNGKQAFVSNPYNLFRTSIARMSQSQKDDVNYILGSATNTELNERITEVVGSSYLGVLPSTHTFPATGSYTFNPSGAGTYVINGNNVVITAADMTDFAEVIIRVTEGVANVKKVAIPTARLPYLEDMSYPINGGVQFIFKTTNKLYRVKDGQTLTSGQTPTSNPEKVELIGGDDVADVFSETDSVTPQAGKQISDWLLGIPDDELSPTLSTYGLTSLVATTNTAVGFNYWMSSNKFPKDAKGEQLIIRVFAGTTLYFKIFEQVGTNFNYIKQKIFTVTTGLNTLDLSDFTFKENQIIFLGGVQMYFTAGGAEGYVGVHGQSNYPATSTSNVAISTLNTSNMFPDFRVTFREIISYARDGQVVSEIKPENNPMIPNVKAIIDYVEENTADKQAGLTEIILIPSYGQSLSIGTDGGPTTFTAPVDIAYNTAGVNSNVQDMNGGYVEMFKEMAIQNNFKLPNEFKIMTCLGGAGGKSITELSKGTTYYNNLINHITTARNTARSLGKTFSVPAFCWTQGEEDYRAGGSAANYGVAPYEPLKYAEKLSKLVDDLTADIKSITGQKNDVICVMYQIASQNPYTRYPRIALEQLKACIQDKRIILAKTMYDVDYNVADYVHAPNKTYRNMGNHYGISIFEKLVKGNKHMPIYPTKHKIVGNSIYVQFHVPVKPLVFDEVNVSPLADGNKGFNIVNVTNEISTTATIAQSSVTITNVELYSADTVKLTLSAPPISGSRLVYGVNGNGWGVINGSGTGTKTSGRVSGARGNLRDSQTYFNPVSDYFQLYNWGVIFEIVL